VSRFPFAKAGFLTAALCLSASATTCSPALSSAAPIVAHQVSGTAPLCGVTSDTRQPFPPPSWSPSHHRYITSKLRSVTATFARNVSSSSLLYWIFTSRNSISPETGCISNASLSIVFASLSDFSADPGSRHNRDSHDSEDLAFAERSWTRWRSMGERSGRRAGGGRGDAKAVCRQARSGGSRFRGSGGGRYWTMLRID